MPVCLAYRHNSARSPRASWPTSSPSAATRSAKCACTIEPSTTNASERASNRAEFPVGREQVRAFLQRKWARELDYRLIKELWTCAGNRIAVRFAYEWHDDSGSWFRSY